MDAPERIWIDIRGEIMAIVGVMDSQINAHEYVRATHAEEVNRIVAEQLIERNRHLDASRTEVERLRAATLKFLDAYDVATVDDPDSIDRLDTAYAALRTETGPTCKHGAGLADYCEPCGRIHSTDAGDER